MNYLYIYISILIIYHIIFICLIIFTCIYMYIYTYNPGMERKVSHDMLSGTVADKARPVEATLFANPAGVSGERH